MYSPSAIADFKALTEKLLLFVELLPLPVGEGRGEGLSQQDAAQIVNDLRDVINFHDHQYYVQAKPIITDFEYDRLYKLLKEIELRYPSLATEDSPTQRVAKELTKE